MPGWFNAHRPRVERITIIRRASRMNAHRPTPGSAQTKFTWVESGRGVSSRAMTGGGDLSPEASAKVDLSRITSNY